MNIGDRIALLRKKEGITQEQLATILGTTRQAVSKWEAGKSTPDIDYAIQIGAHFGVSMDYLLLGKEDIAAPVAPLPENKTNMKPYITALITGTCIILLLPLIASLYRNYIFSVKGVAFTEPLEYLIRWPLIGIVIIGVAAVLIGIGGVVRIRREQKEQP